MRKRCPKCGGPNIYLDSDSYGWFEYCLSCGYTRDLEAVTASKEHLPVADKTELLPSSYSSS